jgi:hypothetical protein
MEMEQRWFADFDGGSPSLAALSEALLESQKRTWPRLSEGYVGLARARVREIRGDSWGVQVQCNPRRIVSTGANIAPEAVRRRPCFLCPGNLPPEQQAIRYREDYLVLCNPMPIFPGHLTIAHARHLPQSLPGHLGTLLRLAADLGPGTTILYNGPLSGASAPDHLHFQAVPAGLMPVEGEIPASRKRAEAGRWDGAAVFRTVGLGRGILVIEGAEPEPVAALAGKVITGLGRLAGDAPGQPCPSGGEGGAAETHLASLSGESMPPAGPSADAEPMLNALCAHTKEGWRLILFPRKRHRPGNYFREGRGGYLVSPGAVDMAGVVITPREEDFLALTPELVAGIYRDVACDDADTEALLARLSSIPPGEGIPAPANATTAKCDNRTDPQESNQGKAGVFCPSSPAIRASS